MSSRGLSSFVIFFSFLLGLFLFSLFYFECILLPAWNVHAWQGPPLHALLCRVAPRLFSELGRNVVTLDSGLFNVFISLYKLISKREPLPHQVCLPAPALFLPWTSTAPGLRCQLISKRKLVPAHKVCTSAFLHRQILKGPTFIFKCDVNHCCTRLALFYRFSSATSFALLPQRFPKLVTLPHCACIAAAASHIFICLSLLYKLRLGPRAV